MSEKITITGEKITRIPDGIQVINTGFGTFAVKTRAQKAARNITANTTVIIPETKVPAFKPCDDFKNMVK